MINYNNSKIYRIEPNCDHEENEIYIGSTTKDKLCQRMATHRMHYKQWKEGKRNKTMSHDLFDKYGVENCSIVLIENVNANNKDELLAREKHYINTLKCVNKYVPRQTEHEYYEKNKEIIIENSKQYYEFNKGKIKQRKSEIFMCECGVEIQKGSKLKHIKTLKHQNYIKEQNI